MLADFQWTEANIIGARDYDLADFEYGVVPMPAGPNNTDGVSPSRRPAGPSATVRIARLMSAS